jgi:restriction system protein
VGRSRSVTRTYIQIQREAEREARARAAAETRAAREAERAERAYQRALAAEAKEQKRLYHEARAAAVDLQNQELQEQVARLQLLLADTLPVDDALNFESLKEKASIPNFDPGQLAEPTPMPSPDSFKPEPLTWLQSKVPGAKAKFDRAWEQGRQAYDQAVAAWQTTEEQRTRRLEAARAEHEREVAETTARLARQHAEVEAFRAGFLAGEREAILDYFHLVLERSSYPDGFPQQFKLAYLPHNKELVVDYELPGYDVVPAMRAFTYVQRSDSINQTKRPDKERRELYRLVVSQLAIRTLHELYEADTPRYLESIVFNGYVDTVNAATGKPEQPYLVTVRAYRDRFLDRDFSRLNPENCLQDLNARVSTRPEELKPVPPVLKISEVDDRFIEEADVLSSLDPRQNLMELSHQEFESLIMNLFARMGFKTHLTRSSNDRGVDGVAIDPHPITGGKAVVQAKRYKGLVPAAAVRELYGTMINEGASHGILVTTSWYGAKAREWAEGKPLKLWDRQNLQALLQEYCGIDMKVVPPEHWKDPTPDPHGIEDHDALDD